MSTNKTTNYQINQWETEDRVLRGKADTATTDSLAARLTDVEGKLFTQNCWIISLASQAAKSIWMSVILT